MLLESSTCRVVYEAHAESTKCLHRNGVQPDERLYGSLMSVAGAAGDVNLAFSLLDEMEAEGLRPSKVNFFANGIRI